MTIYVRFFAAARQIVGQELLEIDCDGPMTIAELRATLTARYVDLAPLLTHTRFAVGEEYVPEDFALSANAEVACIPPVSGG